MISTLVKSASGMFTPIFTALRISSGLDSVSKELGTRGIPSMSLFFAAALAFSSTLSILFCAFLRLNRRFSSVTGGGAGIISISPSISGNSTLYSLFLAVLASPTTFSTC
uniref:Uncharacterized protein n=1 Tax=Triticum urartu TaxID=4572 RepID=A0A8R7Q2H1_TRIUA